MSKTVYINKVPLIVLFQKTRASFDWFWILLCSSQNDKIMDSSLCPSFPRWVYLFFFSFSCLIFDIIFSIDLVSFNLWFDYFMIRLISQLKIILWFWCFVLWYDHTQTRGDVALPVVSNFILFLNIFIWFYFKDSDLVCFIVDDIDKDMRRW